MNTASRVLAVVAFAMVAGPVSAASATTYCVNSPSAAPNCSGTSESSLYDAIAAADADSTGSDTIVLPAGTQASPVFPYLYTGTIPLEIDGQGSSSVVTVAGSLSGGLAVLGDNDSEPSLTLRDFKLVIPAGSDGTVSGIDVGQNAAATISNVDVTSDSTTVTAGILIHGGGNVSGTTVSMPTNFNAGNFGVEVSNSGTTYVYDSTISGQAGLVTAAGATLVVDRCRLAGSYSAGLFAENSSATVYDSLLASISNPALTALSTGTTTTITGRQLTIAPDAGGVGAFARVTGSANATISLTDSVLANPLVNSISTARDGGATGVPSVTTDYSDYDHSTISLYSGTYTPGPHDTAMYLDPKFVNAAAGDFHLLPTSPLLDYDPTPLGGSESVLDLDRFPRITGGARDLGAFQHQPPTVGVASYTVHAYEPATYEATGMDVHPNDPLTYVWKFDDGGTASGAIVTHTFTTVGQHSATVTVTAADGFATSATSTITVTAPLAPRLSQLSQTHAVWRTGRKLATITARRHRPPVGTSFSFTLDQPASVVLTFRRARGSRSRLTLNGHLGGNHVAFGGRLGKRKLLAPGKYTLSVVATNAGRLSSTPASIRFRIVR